MAEYRQETYYDYQVEYEEREKRLQQEAEQISEKRKAVHHGALLFLRAVSAIIAIGAICAVCIGLISIKTEINGVQKNINEMNSQIAELKAENNALLADINESKNIYSIMLRAEEMGMCYPDDAHVIQIG